MIAGKLIKVPSNYTVENKIDEFGNYRTVEWVDPDTNKRVGIKRYEDHTGMCLIRVEHDPFDFIELKFDDEIEETIYDLLRR